MNKKVFFILYLVVSVCTHAAGGSLTFAETAKEVFPEPVIFPAEFRDTIKIKEVEVIGAKRLSEIGLKISGPDSIALHSSLTADLSEILARHTPVFIKNYGRGSQATAHFRGTSASHAQILWNGLNLNSPMRGYTDLSQLPLFFIDDISILHGGSSLTESSGALGGSIRLLNMPDWKQKNAFSGLIEQGSFNTGRYMAKMQLGNTGFQSVTRFYLESSENDFPFYNAGVIPGKRDTLKNGDYHRKALLQEFYYRFPSDLVVSLRGWFQDNNRNLPPLMSYEGAQRTEYQNNDQFRIQFGINKYTGKLDYRFNSGYNQSEMKYFLSVGPGDYVVSDAVSLEKSFDNHFKINYSINKKLSISGSAETGYHRVNADEKIKESGYRKERIEGGILLHLMLTPTDRTGCYFLFRSEYYDRKVIPFIPSAGGEWQIIRHFPLLLKMNVTRNYHKPGLNDLYWIPGGNPELLPEQGFTGEISLASDRKGEEGSVRQELTAYSSEISNWIIWQPASSGAWYWEAANLDRVLSRGLEYEISGSVRVHAWKIMMSGNYAFTRTWQPDSPGSADHSRKNQLIYIPKHAANIHLMISRSGWSAMTDVSYTGKRYTQSSGQTTYYERILTPFWLTNLSLTKLITGHGLNWGIRGKIENLFNIRYQQILWRPMPERNYSITLFAGFKK